MSNPVILLETPSLISVSYLQDILNIEGNSRENVFTELQLIQGGRGEIHFDNQVISVREGDLMVCKPGIKLRTRSSDDYPLKGISIIIGNLKLHNMPPEILLDEEKNPILHLNKNYDVLSRYFTNVLLENSDAKLGSLDLISFMLQSIIIHIIRIANQPKETASISTISRNTRDYIRENYAQDLSLNALASFVFVSPYHLAHIFKEEIGMSPIQFMIKCRIDEAKRMLAETDLSVREIAQLVGYPNANYFNMLFKKIAGESPGKFRKHS
ncbi:MAG: AraC family transcriptional regulator [Candidatus Pristimantibacillus lignocellulolyticus]|uniref:AraC family transcriptional regulator n=1 Tax=Candidatus Pristimantibacillus lignocellulolyticus TaxID=2994561 RepID=A0A9J6ZEX3_9BACL|nr:MAG: AraC family transcriptional regulator [Candidatus Pristimantibacillus lignocellulolyticus]